MVDADPLVVIAHVDHADTAAVQQWADENDLGVRVVRAYAGDQLPDPAVTSRTVVLGGPVSVYDRLPYLDVEVDYLRVAVVAGNRVLGICLGAQLLTHALGGVVRPGDEGPECGLIDVVSNGGRIPLLDGRFFSFHGDAMTPPPGATLLATSDRYPQAWTWGSALAVQFHPELSVDGARDLFALEADAVHERGLDTVDCLRRIGADADLSRRRFFDLCTWWLTPPQDPTNPSATPRGGRRGRRQHVH